ncbi:MAG: DUF190 domain-containing protein [Sphingobacteriia bacterium]|nr:DUF190 domain-containing protein [Sphingobacteriia bacterium]
MESNETWLLMRIFISSTDKHKDGLLYEHIVFSAKEYGIAGATVNKGILGYGSSSVIHSYKFWEVTEKLPVVIEIIDEAAKLKAFYETIRPILETMRYGCLVTTETVDIWLKKSGIKKN